VRPGRRDHGRQSGDHLERRRERIGDRLRSGTVARSDGAN
jgi:hypothetical protein